jgi:hypothetical protein
MPRFRLVLLLLGLTLGSVAGTFVALGAPAGADTAADAGRFLALSNQARASQGVAPLAADGMLAGVAGGWSAHMAAAGTISHNPSLSSQVSGWRSIGENVGMGPTVDSIQQAFVNSPGHYRNIMDGAFSRVGIAVSYSGGTTFVTLDFMQPMAAAAAPAPAAPRPAPAPAAPRPVAVVHPVAPAPAAAAAPVAAPAPVPAPAAAPAPVPAPVAAAPVEVPAVVPPHAPPDMTLPLADGRAPLGAGSKAGVTGRLRRIDSQARPWALALALPLMLVIGLLGLTEGPAAALAHRLPSPAWTRR